MGAGCCGACDNSSLDKTVTDLIVPARSKKLSIALQEVSDQVKGSSEKNSPEEIWLDRKLVIPAVSFVPPKKQDSASARDHPRYEGYLYRTLRTGRSPVKQWAVLTPHSFALYASEGAARACSFPTRSVPLSHVFAVQARRDQSEFVIELLLLIDLKHLGDAKRLRPSLGSLPETQLIGFTVYSEPCFGEWCDAFQSLGNLQVKVDNEPS